MGQLCVLGLEALPDPVKANDCVWELPKNELLAQHLGQRWDDPTSDPMILESWGILGLRCATGAAAWQFCVISTPPLVMCGLPVGGMTMEWYGMTMNDDEWRAVERLRCSWSATSRHVACQPCPTRQNPTCGCVRIWWMLQRQGPRGHSECAREEKRQKVSIYPRDWRPPPRGILRIDHPPSYSGTWKSMAQSWRKSRDGTSNLSADAVSGGAWYDDSQPLASLASCIYSQTIKRPRLLQPIPWNVRRP